MSSRTIAEPIKPVAPVTKIFIKRSFASSYCNTKLLRGLTCCPNSFGNRVERSDRIRRQFECCSAEVVSEMAYGRRAGNRQNVRRPLKKPGKRDLHRSCVDGRRYPIELRRLQWSESSQREEWDISDALLRESIYEGIVIAMCQIVEVLHANNLGNSLTFLQLPGSDVAEADMTNQPLMLQLGEHRQGFLDGSFRWRHHSADSKINYVERIDTEIPKT